MALDPRILLNPVQIAGPMDMLKAQGAQQDIQAQNQMMQMRALQIGEQVRGQQIRNYMLQQSQDKSNFGPDGLPNDQYFSRIRQADPAAADAAQKHVLDLKKTGSEIGWYDARAKEQQAQVAKRKMELAFNQEVADAGVWSATEGMPDAERQQAVIANRMKNEATLRGSGLFSDSDLGKLKEPYDPVASLGAIKRQKDLMAEQRAEEGPTKMRTRVEGEQEIQEEFNPTTHKWEKIGSGPRFARQVAPVVNVNAGSEGKPPSGYKWSTEQPGSLQPIPGGPADPEAIAAKKAATAITIAGGRESVFVNRVVQASRQAIKDIENIAKLPLAAQTTGIFGGRGQQPGLFNAGKEVLAQKLTSQDAQTFNVIATGLTRALAQIETAGVAQGIQEFSKTIDVVAKEGETQLTKLHKMAQMRQIIDASAEATLANDRVSQGQKDLIRETQDQAHKAIPFTHSDLIELAARQETNPRTTLKDILPKIKAGSTAAPEAPQPGDVRKGYRFKGGDPSQQESWEKV